GVDSKKASQPTCQPGGALYGSPSCTTNQFKGVAIVQGSTSPPGCTPVTAGTPVPCNELGDGGTKAGPSTSALLSAGYPGCSDANDDNWTGCVVTLPIANDCLGSLVCSVQTTAQFLICPGAQLIPSSPCNTSDPSYPFPTSAPPGCTSNCHIGRLLPGA